MYTYTCIHAYTHIRIHTHTHTHTYKHGYIHMYIRIYMYIYTLYINMHMHMYIYLSLFLSHMHILYRAWSKYVRWCSQHLSNVHTCTCMVLNNTCECMPTLRKNAYGLVHAGLCNSAAASLPWKLLRTYLESCANIVQAVFYHLPSRRPLSCRPPSC